MVTIIKLKHNKVQAIAKYVTSSCIQLTDWTEIWNKDFYGDDPIEIWNQDFYGDDASFE